MWWVPQFSDDFVHLFCTSPRFSFSGQVNARVGHGIPVNLLLILHWAAAKPHNVLAISITTSKFKKGEIQSTSKPP